MPTLRKPHVQLKLSSTVKKWNRIMGHGGNIDIDSTYVSQGKKKTKKTVFRTLSGMRINGLLSANLPVMSQNYPKIRRTALKNR